MKTSIIISTIAAICLMITFSEKPIRRDIQNQTNTLYGAILYLPANNYIAKPEVKWSEITKTDVYAKTKVNLNQDFSYLKFDVADYTETDEVGTEVNDMAKFDYLKFDVNKYEVGNGMKSNQSNEISVNEFDFLKFNVNGYTATDIDETIESPVNEFDYLKFNVNKYSSNDKGSNQCVELQITE